MMANYLEYNKNLFEDSKLVLGLKYRWYGENIIIDYLDDEKNVQSVGLMVIIKPFYAVKYLDRIYVLPLKINGFVIFDDLKFGVVYNYEDLSDQTPLVYKLLIKDGQ